MNKKIKNLDYIQRFIDLVLIIFTWWVAYYLKFELQVLGESANVSFDRYMGYGVLLVIISLITFKNTKLYGDFSSSSLARTLMRQIKANFISFIVFMVLAFFSSQDRLSRVHLITYFIISTVLLSFSKLIFHNILSKISNQYVLIGSGRSLVDYYENLLNTGRAKILYWVDAPSEIENVNKVEDVDFSKLEKENAASVIVGYENDQIHKAYDYLEKLSELIIPLVFLPDLKFARVGYSLKDFKGQPVFHINEPHAKPLGMLFKRLFDIFSCGLGMILISPILLAIAAIVKFTSKGPIFYGQVRMGVDGKEFKMWKFRSMVVGEANTEGWTIKDDPRVTKIGKFIRKTSLDELPQLWNVVVGDMSLVGPRPERPVYVEQFRKEIPGYMLRHKYKAGITGWAQVNGWRGDTSIEKRIECDIWYIRNWSFWLDISIIFLTFWKGFINKNAY